MRLHRFFATLRWRGSRSDVPGWWEREEWEGCPTSSYFFQGGRMRQPHIDDFVRLTQAIPELALPRGAVGVVRSTWFAPSVAYEVEFHKIGHDYQCRALLMAEQVQVEEGSLLPIELQTDEHAHAMPAV